MIAVSQRPTVRNSVTVSFSSTLYLWPILDILLADVPGSWQAEVRLGLQEALVNAAKHGNKLDPGKKVVVRCSVINNEYWWMIEDQGCGFGPPSECKMAEPKADESYLPRVEAECGRGLFILYQIFDQVQWNDRGTELRLCKEIKGRYHSPLIN